MAGETAAGPIGEWRVRRVWVGRRRPRWRASDGGLDLLGAVPDLGSGTIGLVIGAIVLVLLLVFVVLPLLLLLGWLLLIFLPLLLLGIAGRVLFRRPWRIEATRGHERHAWDVVGWRESGLAMDEVRRSVRLGGAPRTARGARVN